MKPGRSIDELVTAIAPYLEEPAVVDRVTTYFGSDGFFSGGSFERLWGGGDRPEVAKRITEQEGLPRGEVTSDVWCREVLLEGCSHATALSPRVP